MICKCYRAENNFWGKVGSCWGTQERDACSCGGDKSKCDFYPSVREEGKKPVTHGDRIRSMSDEELASYLCKAIREGLMNVFPTARYSDEDIQELDRDWLDWLRQEATE